MTKKTAFNDSFGDAFRLSVEFTPPNKAQFCLDTRMPDTFGKWMEPNGTA